MSKLFIEDKTFLKVDFSKDLMIVGDYENCIFTNCDFSNSSLSNILFANCIFNGCNLCSTRILKTAF